MARALGFTPSQDQVASALLGMPPAEARAELHRRAAVALAATASRAPLRDVPSAANRNQGDCRIRTRARLPKTRARMPLEFQRRGLPDPPVAVRASTGPGAGAGLFSTEQIPRGGLVALYAGVYTPPVPPVTPGADGVGVTIPAPASSDDDVALEYVIHLAGGGYLDGAAHAAAARAAAASGACAGWGVAALANHPPSGIDPNVVAVDVSWADAEAAFPDPGRSPFREAEAERVARVAMNPVNAGPWFVDGATGMTAFVPPTVPTRGIALVAATRLEPGREVFFNYELPPAGAPGWYRAVPVETAWRVAVDGEGGARGGPEEAADRGETRARDWMDERRGTRREG